MQLVCRNHGLLAFTSDIEAETAGTTKPFDHQGKPPTQEPPEFTIGKRGVHCHTRPSMTQPLEIVEPGNVEAAKPSSYRSESDAHKPPEPVVGECVLVR